MGCISEISINLCPSLESQKEAVPFSHKEAEQLAAVLNQLQERLTEHFQLTARQVQFVQAKVTYLESKAKEGFSRGDWLHLLIGVVTTIAVTLALSEEEARRLWTFLKDAVPLP